MSLVLGPEKDTPRSLPLRDISGKIFCRRRRLSRWDSEAMVMEKLSTQESIMHFGIAKCKGVM